MRRPLVLLCFVFLIASFAVPASASAALGELSLISRVDGLAGVAGDGNSYTNNRAISADGRYVVFSSYAENLGGPTPGLRDVFRRDTLLGRTELVSRANGLNGAVGDDTSFGASVSADGNRVAFVSSADNLSTDDNNTFNNIFVRDIAAGTTVLASRISGVAGGAANNTSLIPNISGDGTVVGFQSAATNIDTSQIDNNGQTDAYIRDFKDSTTRLVSKSTLNVLGNQFSGIGDLSYDGNLITIETSATTLGGTIAGGTTNVYVRNRSAGTTTLVSQPTGTTNVGATEAGESTITDAGDRVAFSAQSTNLAPDAPPSLSSAYVRDLAGATTTLVSRSPDGAPSNSSAGSPVISGDGTILTFHSAATNLDGPTNSLEQAFVRDLASGRNTLISRVGRTGPIGDRPSNYVTPGSSSRFVLFESNATNLTPDSNGTNYQLFMRDVKVVDPIPAASINGKSFKSRLSKRSFTIKATTGGGATGISGKATIRVSKKIVKSGKVVVKLKSRAVTPSLTSHKLRFTLSKKQNRRVLKALKTKKSRVKVSIGLTATGSGTPGSAKFSGKLRR